MGRDFTPRELWIADKALNLRDLKVFNAKTGEEVKLHEPDMRYPILSFLYPDDFPACRVSRLAETALERITKSEEDDDIFVPKSEIETVLYRWFKGELDENFHYSEENHARLRNFLWGDYPDFSGFCPHLHINFPDWQEVESENWSRHVIGELFEKEYTGLYREKDGSYTLQQFHGDDVVFCETVDM